MKKKWEHAPRTEPDLLSHLLSLRGIDSASSEEFLNPPIPQVLDIQKEAGLSEEDVVTALSLIEHAQKESRPIVIHGDYDVDGMCATALLWEALYFDVGYTKAYPFIPNRFDHGYGISTASIDAIAEEYETPLLISVDCGITSVDAVAYAKELGWDVIITDHHAAGSHIPTADAVVHSTLLTGAGIAWVLSERIRMTIDAPVSAPTPLELVAMATIADVQPLQGVNRQLVLHGLSTIAKSSRVGLRQLLKVSGMSGKPITPGVVGWHLAPRLNAAGRIDQALDALRLLCTRDENRAAMLADKLHQINQDRQALTIQSVEQAEELVDPSDLVHVVNHAEWHEGIIGLIAGRIKETHYRPTLAITTAGEVAKGSARSIEGFNIIEALREHEDLFESVGGHPMAAGFTLSAKKIPELRTRLNDFAKEVLTEEQLIPTLAIDAQLELNDVSLDLVKILSQLQPYGVGNPTPRFQLSAVPIHDISTVGKESGHLKIRVGTSPRVHSAMWFRHGHVEADYKIGDLVDMVVKIDENEFNGRKSVQLIVEDMRRSS